MIELNYNTAVTESWQIENKSSWLTDVWDVSTAYVEHFFLPVCQFVPIIVIKFTLLMNLVYLLRIDELYCDLNLSLCMFSCKLGKYLTIIKLFKTLVFYMHIF